MRVSPALLFALKAVLAVVILAFVARIVDPAAALEAARNANPWPLALAFLLIPANIGLETYRWWRLVKLLAPEVLYREALSAVLGGYSFGLLTPGRVGEFVGRAALLKGVDGGKAAALTFGEKIATLAVILVGGLLAVVYQSIGSVAASPLWVPAIVFSALWAAALLLAILHPSGARAILGTLLPFAPVRRALTAFDAIPMHEAGTLLGLSAVRYVIFAGQFALLTFAFAPEAPFGAVASGVALVLFAKSAVHSITLGDLGIREGAAVFFLGAAGVAEVAALNASLGVFAFNLLLPALVGIPFLMRLRASAASDPVTT